MAASSRLCWRELQISDLLVGRFETYGRNVWSNQSMSARVDIDHNMSMFDAGGSSLRVCCESGSSCGASYVPAYIFIFIH